MTASKIQPRLTSPGGESPVSGSEEQREFLQGRLALLGKVGALFIGCYFVLTNLAMLSLSGATPAQLFRQSGSVITLVNLSLCAVAWLLCARRPLPYRVLSLLDVSLILLFCSMVALSFWLGKSRPDVFFQSLLNVVYAVMARAVIVPAKTGRTAWISAAGFVPMFAVAIIIQQDESLGQSKILDGSTLSLYLISGLLGAALATVVSHVIFGLRIQIRKARRLGQYQLEEKIGQGGMGEVYRATHAMLRRPTAVKLLRPDMAGEQSIARFEREVRLTSLLTHPNTIAIYDYGRTPEGIFYYAMELLTGLDLEQLVEQDGPQSPGRVIHVLTQVCSSLVEAHEEGLIHRDIKPPNIILCERGHVRDVVKVVDFGLVKHIEPGVDASSGGYSLTGTPLYMSPEALRTPDQVDARTDLYAVGAVGYYLLTGRNLYEVESVMEALNLQLRKTPERPSARLGARVPEDLEAIIMRCLEKDRDRRPRSAAELREELCSCADANAWSEESAGSWWREREAAFHGQTAERPPEAARPAPPSVLSDAETIVVDMNDRVE